MVTSAGILTILFWSEQPNYSENLTTFEHYVPLSVAPLLVAFCCLGNAALFGLSCVIIKKMKDMHQSVILFYMGAGLLIFNAVFYPYNLKQPSAAV